MIKDKEWRLALKFTLAFTAVAILIVMLIKLAPIITIFVIALFIVYLLLPPVSFLIRHRFPPLLAAASAGLVVLLFMFLFFYLLIPGLIIELSELTNFISTEVVGDWSQFIERIADLDGRFNLQLADRLNEYYVTFTSEAPALVQQLLKYLANFSMALVSKAWIGLMLIFLVFYLVQDLEKAKDNLTLLAPQIYQKDVVHILGIVDQKVGAFIRGTLMKSLFVGVLTGGGLAIAGLPFAIMLGALRHLQYCPLYRARPRRSAGASAQPATRIAQFLHRPGGICDTADPRRLCFYTRFSRQGRRPEPADSDHGDPHRRPAGRYRWDHPGGALGSDPEGASGGLLPGP